MNYLLYNKGSFISGRLLATLLGLKATSDINKVKNGKLVIRYGNSYGEFSEDTTLNSPEVIKLCSNSVRFSKWCLDNGFNSPIYTDYNPDENYSYPFLLRDAYHKQGKDIVIVKDDENKKLVKKNYHKFHVPYIKADIELGIHIINGKVVKIFKKILNNDEDTFIKNQKSCHYHIINNIENNFTIAQDICLNLFQKLGLNFGRVDIAYNSQDKRYIIWEVNTAPGLNKLTGELYASILREIINV